MTPDVRPALRRLVKSRYGLLAASGALVVVALLVVELALGGAGKRLGVVARPQPFTELYFTSSTKPPARLDGRPLRLTFVIDSHEERAWTFRWSVLARRGDTSARLVAGTVELAPGQSFRKTVEVPGTRLRGATLVEVRLAQPVESIDLHLPDATASATSATSATARQDPSARRLAGRRGP